MTIEERIVQMEKKLRGCEQKESLQKIEASGSKDKDALFYEIGKLFIKHFPILLEQMSEEQWDGTYKAMDEFMEVLAMFQEKYENLMARSL